MKRAQNSVHLISSLISFFTKFDIENAHKKLRKKKQRKDVNIQQQNMKSATLRIVEQRSYSEQERTWAKDGDRGYILVILSVLFLSFFFFSLGK